MLIHSEGVSSFCTRHLVRFGATKVAAVALAEAEAYTVPVQKRGPPGRGGRMFNISNNRNIKL